MKKINKIAAIVLSVSMLTSATPIFAADRPSGMPESDWQAYCELMGM